MKYLHLFFFLCAVMLTGCSGRQDETPSDGATDDTFVNGPAPETTPEPPPTTTDLPSSAPDLPSPTPEPPPPTPEPLLPTQELPPPTPDPTMWQRIWSDEFDGDELDLSVWEIMTGTGAQFGLTGWGNYEAQYYHADNITVANGYLRIEARHERRSSPGEGSRNFTSGRIRSVGTPGYGDGISILYGRVEARIRLPEGNGLWPAFWMMPTHPVYGGWPISGEIDIMEAMGRLPERSTAAIHFGRTWPNNTYNHSAYRFPEGRDITDFNVYAVEWEPGEIRWFVNEDLFWTQRNWWSRHADAAGNFMFPAPFDQPFHILLNLAVGGHFDPTGTAAINTFDFPVAMYVDYVRVYELVGRPLREVPPSLIHVDTNFRKDPLPDGNIIRNGTFDQGDNGLMNWQFSPGMAVTQRDPTVQGINLPTFNRQLAIRDLPVYPDLAALRQSYAAFYPGAYTLSFEGMAVGGAGYVIFKLADEETVFEYNFTLGDTLTAHTVAFTPEIAEGYRLLSSYFLFSGDAPEIIIDNITLRRR